MDKLAWEEDGEYDVGSAYLEQNEVYRPARGGPFTSVLYALSGRPKNTNI